MITVIEKMNIKVYSEDNGDDCLLMFGLLLYSCNPALTEAWAFNFAL